MHRTLLAAFALSALAAPTLAQVLTQHGVPAPHRPAPHPHAASHPALHPAQRPQRVRLIRANVPPRQLARERLLGSLTPDQKAQIQQIFTDGEAALQAVPAGARDAAAQRSRIEQAAKAQVLRVLNPRQAADFRAAGAGLAIFR